MSSTRNTMIRSMHDLGAAAWFGGALMGAVALNGATSDIADPKQRTQVASTQNQMRVLQWVTPVLTGLIVILGAQQGEQQRPTQVAEGIVSKLGRRARRS